MRVTCHRCGTPGHLAAQYKFKDWVCYQCGKKGHLLKVCQSTPKPQDPTQVPKCKRRSAQKDSGKSSEDEFVNTIGSVKRGPDNPPPIKVQVGVDDCLIGMEVDTGASVIIMAETTYNRLWPGRSLAICDVKLCTFSKELRGGSRGGLRVLKHPPKLPKINYLLFNIVD